MASLDADTTDSPDTGPFDAESDSLDDAADVCVPSIEVCDGLDQDCDGVTDNGDPGAGVECDTGHQGVCAAGLTHCESGMVVCVQSSPLAEEVCDGKDNDCDGETDESDSGVGVPCVTTLFGPCATGTSACVAGTVVCTPNALPAVEICDAIDNDCDGAVDDGDPGGGGSCSTGLFGVCEAGVEHCVSGALTCVPSVQASPEVCNNLDDDCDGVVDNGDPGGGVPCTTGLQGVCAAGTTACVNGTIVCNQDLQPTTEVCNGLDDDCDGAIDDGNPGGGSGCSTGKLGVCAAGTIKCVGGGLACVQDQQPANTDPCNGLDDDCDGTVDDTNTCTGSSVCSGGSCIGMPSSECVGYRFEGHAYAYCGEPSGYANWSAASSICNSYGGHLATISTWAENSFLEGLASARYRDTWIGLYRSAGNCSWRWVTGEPVVMTDWGSGQPDGLCGDADCGQFWAGVNFSWNNDWCSSGERYICEWDQ